MNMMTTEIKRYPLTTAWCVDHYRLEKIYKITQARADSHQRDVMWISGVLACGHNYSIVATKLQVGEWRRDHDDFLFARGR